MKKSGILASLSAAQALIESNKGNSGLAVKGNNLFGIKGTFNGESVKMETTEYYGGKPFKVMADFRKYPSWAESIADHSALFNRMDRYKNLRGCTDWRKATEYVQKDGYATSPTYTQTLQKTIITHELNKWDDEVLYHINDFDEMPKTGNPYREPTKNVKFNSRGNDVRWLQYELNNHGHCGLIIDGIAGERTITALKDFQSSHDLVADGICGVLTREKLKNP